MGNSFSRKPYSGSYDDFKDVFIDAKTMEVHQEKHHEGYQNKVNAALEGVEHDFETIEDVLRNIDTIPEDTRTAVRNNGGGLANHNLFFSIISPNGEKEPVGTLAEDLNSAFGSFDSFKEEFSTAAKTHFGSGWAWLATDENGENLHINSLPNQDSPYLSGHRPVVGLDMWEHAYYLMYQNNKVDYIEAFWNVIDWEKVNELYESYR